MNWKGLKEDGADVEEADAEGPGASDALDVAGAAVESLCAALAYPAGAGDGRSAIGVSLPAPPDFPVPEATPLDAPPPGENSPAHPARAGEAASAAHRRGAASREPGRVDMYFIVFPLPSRKNAVQSIKQS